MAKELFDMPPPENEPTRGPVLAILVACFAFWLLVAAAGYGLVRWAEALS